MTNNMSKAVNVLKIVGLIITIGGATAVGAVKLLGVETVEDHEADITRIESTLDTQTLMLQCLLWNVPGEICLDSK